MSKKNNLPFAVRILLVLGSIMAFQNAHAVTDTTYHYFFEYQGIPYQVNLHDSAGEFQLSLFANQLELTIDSSRVNEGGPARINVTGFHTPATTTAIRRLPADFNANFFATTVASLLMEHAIVTRASAPNLLTLLKQDPALTTVLLSTYQKIKEQSQQQILHNTIDSVQTAKTAEIRQLNKAHRDTIDSLLNVIDVIDEANRYGGQFEFSDRDSLGIAVYNSQAYKENDSSKSFHYCPYDTGVMKFYPKAVVIKTFNNFIDMIHVDGFVRVDGRSYLVDFYNSSFSLALKSIYERKHYLAFRIPVNVPDPNCRGTNSSATSTISLGDYKTYLVNITDLVRLNAYKNHFTFMAKDDSYLIDRDNKIVPYQRRTFYDYLNFTTFLDFLGVVEKTPNSLIQIEGKVRLPLRLVNSRFLSSRKKSFRYGSVFFPKVDAYLNAAFINGSQADTRYGTIFNQSANSASLDSLFIDNFDLIRKNNIRTGIELGVLKSEMKGSNLNLYFDYGIHFDRTSLQYIIVNTTAPDEIRQFNAWSWTHGPIVRFEYRPDQNLGMDLSFTYNTRQRLLNSDNDNLRVYEISGPLNKNIPQPPGPLDLIGNYQKANYKIEFNTYFMVNPVRSNGGLYFRLSNYFNYNFSQIFPQVLVGYSTRLSGMVKNLREKGSRD